MAPGTLYTYPNSFRANKILIAAAYSVTNVTVDPNFEYGKTNTSAEFLKKFPLGKVPAYESNGTYFNESNAIAQYVSNEALLGGCNAADRAAVTEYISFSENEILPSACTWVYPTLGFKQYNKQDTESAMNHLKKCLSKLNNDLLTKTFLVGERVTLADITLCTTLVMLYVQVLDPKFREEYVNLNRWFVTCVNQPNFKKVLGEVKLCEKMATFDNKRYQELHPKGGKDKAKKESKPKETKKEKKADTTDAPKPAAEPEKKKEKIDYFADVPKSDFILDAWKKVYMNNELSVSLKYLEENFDPNAYSIWQCDYQMDDKVKQDYKLQFLTDNLAGGFLQRVETSAFMKNAHGILSTFAEKEPFPYFSLSGLWIFRGLKVAFQLNDDWNTDAAYCKFKKLDLKNDADKKVIHMYLNGQDSQGRECEAYKLFG